MRLLFGLPTQTIGKNEITCAWHIRLGDVVIAQEVGLVNALAVIYKTASELKKTVKHHVFSNGKMCTPPTNYYCGMHAGLVANGTKFWTEAKEQETLELMIRLFRNVVCWCFDLLFQC